MADAIIDNPILNTPFAEPTRHFRFGDEGITGEIVQGRRASSYFLPIPAARKKGQLQMTDWTLDRLEETKFINEVRRKVGMWRIGGWVGVTPTTRRLLDHWTDPDRERKLFFCQVEALETAIYISEVAHRYGDAWIANELREKNDLHNPGLMRLALKMATGSGKTVVMGMLIAWQTLNKLERPQDGRFGDAFLIVAPGITIRDRLRVLLPSDPDSYYRQRDLVPPADMARLGEAKIVITNFHSFMLRESGAASRVTKAILTQGGPSPFTESPDRMVRRVCRELGTKRNVIVLNDEAHHCYRPKGDPDVGAGLTGDEKKEAQQRERDARVWISGLEAVATKIGIRAVYDLSATPFFLRGSGYNEGTLFPWVVSDFSLIDAIESGIVKVPRVPVADDSGAGAQPTYRDLWLRIRDDLPKKGRRTAGLGEEPRPPAELESALVSLYDNYAKAFARFEERAATDPGAGTPPVFIVVCNNTSVSKLVFDWIAGWEKTFFGNEGTRKVKGKLGLFSNVTDDGVDWRDRPRTILIDSEQLESGDAMSADFKRIASREIEEFRAEYRQRYPGRDAEALTDEDLLREVMNTVGKPGKLGEQIRCVVSVSMLTEGWDANTVTHILGVRAFGTQLLCEQVVGRGLRRRSYAVNGEGFFEPEYAEVYGVPFSFIPCSGATADPPPGKAVTRVRAIESREHLELTFPRITGYRYEVGTTELHARFTDEHRMTLSTEDIPTSVDVSGVVGEREIHTLDSLLKCRRQEVAFALADRVLRGYFPDTPWLFPQLVEHARSWMDQCVTLKDNTFIQLLLITQRQHAAAALIHRAIIGAEPGPRRVLAQPAPYDALGSTCHVDFDTTKAVWETDAERCHVSHVVMDSNWEAVVAERLEDMPEVLAYAKNQGMGFTIPYVMDGDDRSYVPDFLVRMDDGRGADDPLNLVVEVSGAARRDKAEKVHTARELWVPGVNNLGDFGRWSFVEVSDPWDAKNLIRAHLATRHQETLA
ncbi:MAG: BPTD_3080 family restriction endonuclease [Dehalococcoidia bacterium]